ncbi:MAG: LeuA family protein [Candidatus Eisenbacteria bacterium]
MEPLSEDRLIYDWNHKDGFSFRHRPGLELDDETLRDGLQSPSITDPPVEKKLEILHLMERLGIQGADLGLPGAGPRAFDDVLTMAREIERHRMRIRPNCAVRTVKGDVQALLEVSQQAGYPIEAAMFIGSSPIRLYAEGWTLDHVLKLTEEAVTFAVQGGIPVMYVTEDTTRSDADAIRKLFTTAIECGARRVCVADTVGYATPVGVTYLIRFVREVVDATGEEVKVDFHGHNDRGCAIPNSMAAIAAGADRIHATALGIGERVGNTSMDHLLVNLRLEGIIDTDLTCLPEYCEKVSGAVGVPVPVNYPVIGRDAYRTSTGVHAAAIIKAHNRGAEWLADRVYAGTPAGMVGRHQEIEIGFMSGVSNVVYWLTKHGIDPEKDLVDEILRFAKKHTHVLSDDDVMEIVKFHRARSHGFPTNTVEEWRKEIRS